MKVLFICQYPTRVEALARAMQQQWPDLTHVVALDGPAGSEASQNEEPDLVLFYEVAPDEETHLAIEDIRIFSDVPIVVAAEGWEERDVEKALEYGADRYIRTPAGSERVVAHLTALLRRF